MSWSFIRKQHHKPEWLCHNLPSKFSHWSLIDRLYSGSTICE